MSENDLLDEALQGYDLEGILSRPDPVVDDAVIHREITSGPLTEEDYLLPLYHADHIPENLPPPMPDRHDPLAPLNLSRHGPDEADIFIRCLPVHVTGPGWHNTAYTLVDTPDWEMLGQKSWRFLFNGNQRYVRRDAEGITVLLHRLVMERKLRENPDYLFATANTFGFDTDLPANVLARQLLGAGHVHHLNHDTEDNRSANLELVKPALNSAMQHKQAGQSGYRGVEVTAKGLFRARIRRTHQGQHLRQEVGLFATALEAAANRILYLLCYPHWMQKGYRPAPDELPLWTAVATWLESGTPAGQLQQLPELSAPTLELYHRVRSRL